MSIHGVLVVLACLVISTPAFASGATRVNVLEVYDGDTFKIEVPPESRDLFGDRIGVRVYGIQAPEIRTRNECEKLDGYVAKRFLENFLLCDGCIVLLYAIQPDKYYRLLARVVVINPELPDKVLLVGPAMLETGFAVEYFGERKKPWVCRN